MSRRSELDKGVHIGPGLEPGPGDAASSSLSDSPPGREAILIGCLFIYVALMWVWGLDKLDITTSMEASRAVVARGMMRTGDYVIPKLGTTPYLAKPPLFCWAVAATSHLSGRVTERSVRLVSALCAVAALLVMYVSVRPVFGWPTAYVASLAAATTPIVFEQATIGMVNMMLSLGVSISLFSAFYMLEPHRRAWVYAVTCGVGLAMGLMTKWPMVLLFFLPTLTLYMGFQREGDLLADRRYTVAYLAAAAFVLWMAMVASATASGVSMALYVLSVCMLLYFGFRDQAQKGWYWPWVIVLSVTVLLAAPWPILAVRRLSQTFLGTLQKECWSLRTSDVGSTNREPIWFYLLRFSIAVLPYTLFVPLAFSRTYASGSPVRERRMLLFLHCWFAGSLVLLSVSSRAKEVRYLLPAFPAVAILAADVMVRGWKRKLRPWMNLYVHFLGASAVYVLCCLPFILAIAWFNLGLGFSGWLVAAIAVTAGAAASGVYMHRVWQSRWAWLAALAVALIGVKIFLHFGYAQIVNHKHSERPVCARMRNHLPAGETLYLYGLTSPTIMFYLDAEPLENCQPDRSGLKGRQHTFVCIERRNLGSFKFPGEFRQAVLDRVRHAKGELLLLRLDRVS